MQSATPAVLAVSFIIFLASVTSTPTYSGLSQSDTAVILQWSKTGGFPVDGVFWSVAVEPGNSNRLYAGIENLGFMFSSDGGTTWERHDPGHHFNRGILLDTIRSNLLYYIYGGGLVVIDRNTGAELKATGFGTSPGYADNNRAESIVEDPSGNLYIATPAGVFKSTDQGSTVEKISQSLPNGTTYSALAVDPSNPSVIYAGTRGPWYYDSILVNSVPAGNSGKGLYKSTNGGNTWQLIGSSYLQAGLNIDSIVVNPKDSSNIFVATSQGVFKSTDSGNSWVTVDSGLSNRSVWILVMNPINPNQLFAGTWGGGLFVTSDGGHAWAKSGFNGIDFHRDRIFSLAFDPNNYNTLYLGTGNGMFRYDTQSRSYSHVAGTVFHSAAVDLAVDPFNSSILYTAESSGRDAYRSFNGGNSWEFMGPFQPLEATRGGYSDCLFSLDCPPYSIDHTYGMQVAVNSSNTRIVYYSSANGLYVSRNRGNNWTVVKTGVLDEQFHIHAIAIYPKNTSIMYLSTGGGYSSHFIFTHMLKSTDGGKAWALIDNGLPSENYHMENVLVNPENPNVVYMASTTMGFGCQPDKQPVPLCVDVGIYKTVDGGSSWFAVNNGLGSLDVLSLAFDPANSSVIYAGAGNSLYVSQNAGDSWKRIPSFGGTGHGAVSAIAVDPRMPTLIFVGTLGGGGVYASTDGGNTWAPVNNGFGDQFGVPDVQDLVIDSHGGTVYAAAEGVFRAAYLLVTPTTSTTTATASSSSTTSSVTSITVSTTRGTTSSPSATATVATNTPSASNTSSVTSQGRLGSAFNSALAVVGSVILAALVAAAAVAVIKFRGKKQS